MLTAVWRNLSLHHAIIGSTAIGLWELGWHLWRSYAKSA